MELVITFPDPESEKICLPWTWRPVKRRMLPGCELFREGDTAMHLARKLVPLEDDDDNDSANSVVKETIPCSAIGCPQTFTSLLSYENHYKSSHCHTCLTCRRTFPSQFLMELHIEEHHDPLFALLASRQDMYRCLAEDCSLKFRGAADRRQHMVTVHSYPANFRFQSIRVAPQCQHRKKKLPQTHAASGDMNVDKPSSAHRRNDSPKGDTSDTSTLACTPLSPALPSPSSGQTQTQSCGAAADVSRGLGEGGGGEDGMEMGEAEKEAPRRVFVHKVPHNFTFGHGISKGFQRPPGKKRGKKKGGHWHQRTGDDVSGETTTNIENVDMKDMAEALSETV